MTKTKVLCYISTRFFEGGGLSSVMLNYWREIWSNPRYDNLVVGDFISHGPIDEALIEEVHLHGGKVFELPSRKVGLIHHAHEFTRVIKGNQYDVLHYNYDTGFDAIELMLARQMIPSRICHVHNSNPRAPFVNSLFRPIVRRSYTRALACSKTAGINLFGTNAAFMVLNNAINTRRFAYNEVTRDRMRKEFGLKESQFVVGHVGRMNPRNEKNHGFLLRAFALACEKQPNMRLALVGDGERRREWEELAINLGLSNKVLFLGFRTDIPDVMQALDLFCFPSRWEGLGMAAIEAQASGLPTIVSDAVPKEVGLTCLAQFAPIAEGNESFWAAKMLSYANDTTIMASRNSQDALNGIRAGGFDIATEAEKLIELYVQHEY